MHPENAATNIHRNLVTSSYIVSFYSSTAHNRLRLLRQVESYLGYTKATEFGPDNSTRYSTRVYQDGGGGRGEG